MRHMLELAALLLALTLGHNIVRGNARLFRETARGLGMWLISLLIVAWLMFHARALDYLVPAAVGVGIIYVLWRALTHFVFWAAGVPYLHPPRRGSPRRLLRAAGYGRREARAAVRALRRAGHSRAMIAAAAVEICQGERKDGAAAEMLQREIAALQPALTALLEAIGGRHKRSWLDRAFAENALLRGGRQWALTLARTAAREKDVREAALGELAALRVEESRAAALEALDIECRTASPPIQSAWRRLGSLGILAVICPACGYAFLRLYRRAILFALCQLPAVAYGVLLLMRDRGAGWVFLAVAAALHLLALLHLDVVAALDADRERAGSAKGGG